MFGEKFIEKKIEGNKVIRISEFKEFDYNFREIAQELNDYFDDDPETQYYKGLVQSFDDLFCIDCDKISDWINDIIFDNKEKLREYYEEGKLEEWLKELEKAKGFTIYFDNKKEDYEKEQFDDCLEE